MVIYHNRLWDVFVESCRRACVVGIQVEVGSGYGLHEQVEVGSGYGLHFQVEVGSGYGLHEQVEVGSGYGLHEQVEVGSGYGLHEQVEVGSGYGLHEHSKRSTDVLAANWVMGKPAGFDFTITSTASF